MFDLKNKIAVVTGGGSGIGQAISVLFAQQGAFVHVIEVSEAAAANTLERIATEGGQAKAHTCDVTQQETVQATFANIGAFDILVNNAGIAHVGNVENTSAADFERVLGVNVKGVYNCLHAAIPTLKSRGGGVILNVASIANHVGLSDRFAYSTSKGAVFAMTLSVAKDYVKHNIRCNSISPARVHTPFVDGFFGQKLSRTRGGNVRKIGGYATHRSHGQTRGNRRARAVFVQRTSGVHYGLRLSNRRRIYYA